MGVLVSVLLVAGVLGAIGSYALETPWSWVSAAATLGIFIALLFLGHATAVAMILAVGSVGIIFWVRRKFLGGIRR